MRAVVLVGGFGTRLRPLTLTTPKQLLPVAHRPMLDWVVGRLGAQGVTEAILALGYKADAFKAQYPDGTCNGVQLRYAVEPEPLDTAGAVRFAADAVGGIDETFLVINSDVLTDLDVRMQVAFHRERGAAATLHLVTVDDPSRFGVVALDARGRVERFVEKPAPGTEPSNLVSAGTYVLEPSVLERIDRGRRVSIERETFPALVAEGTLYGHATEDYWLDTGTLQAYLRANLDHLETRGGSIAAVAASAQVAPGATVERSVIGDGAVVHAGAVVIGSVLLRGAVVEGGARVERSVLGAGARVGAGATLQDSIVADHATVADGAALTGARVEVADPSFSAD